MGDSWMVILNPASGGGRGKREGERRLQALRRRGIKAEAVWTRGPGDAENLARGMVSEGFRQVVVCGGDGTAHEAIQALAGSGAVLGLMPVGRGNDLARILGIPGDPEGAVEVLAAGVERRMDLGRVGQRFFATVACWSFGAEVSRATRRAARWSGGKMGYALAVLREWWRFECPWMEVSGDFGQLEGRFFVATAANSPFFGGGIRIAPGAAIDDGRLEVCLVGGISRPGLLRLWPKVYRGTHGSHPGVFVGSTGTLRVSSRETLWVFADGEPVGQSPVEISAVGGALTVQVPGGAAGRRGSGNP